MHKNSSIPTRVVGKFCCEFLLLCSYRPRENAILIKMASNNSLALPLDPQVLLLVVVIVVFLN